MLIRQFMSGIRTTIITGICIVLLAGCSESPEKQASKELRKGMQETLTATENRGRVEFVGEQLQPVDYVKVQSEARDRIQDAIRSAGAAKETKEAAYLASGQLAVVQAEEMRLRLYDASTAVNEVVTSLAEQLANIEALMIQNEREMAGQQGADQELQELEAILAEGVGGQPALQEQLRQRQARLSELRQQKQTWRQRQQQAQQRANEIQNRADSLLRQAETADADRKYELSKQAYELMLTRKQHYQDAQNAEDQIGLIDSEIQIVEPQVAQLQAQVEGVQAKIQANRTSDQRTQAGSRVEELNSLIAQGRQRLLALAGELNATIQQFQEQAAGIATLLDEAAADFEKVRDRDLKSLADLQQTKALLERAHLYGDAVMYSRALNQRLAVMDEMDSDDLIESLTVAQDAAGDAVAKYSEAAMSAYDQVLAQYEQILPRASSYGKTAASNLRQSYVMALYGKMQLAEDLENYTVADAAIKKADEIITQAAQADAGFRKTLAAKLFNPDAALTPQLAVDNTKYYESVYREFQRWKQLPRDQREAAVRDSLARLDAVQAEDADLAEYLAEKGLRQELQDALEKGFDAPVGPGDPNSV